MELRVLRYFLTVAQEGNISRAAEQLHITQPTLSRQMQQLEDEMGTLLFDRGSRRITLTEKGILLRRRAEEIIAQVDKTREEMHASDEIINGTISVGCGEVLAVQLLAEMLKHFKDKYPAVTYKIKTGNAVTISEQLKNGLLDFGLLLEPADISDFDYLRLMVKERWVVTMRTDDPLADKKSVTAEDLIGRDVILPWRAAVNRELRSWFGSCYDKIHIQINCDMSTNAFIMVQNKMGISFNIEASKPYMGKDIFRRIPLSPAISTTNVLAWKKYEPFSAAAKKFMEFAQAYLKENNDSIKARYYDNIK